LQFEGERHRIPLSELTGGRAITVYAQHEVVKDLIAARLAAGREIRFEASDVSLHDVSSDRPLVRYRIDGSTREIECDIIAGCDGSHGISRASIPTGAYRVFERAYPFAWLGILAAVPPSLDELIYAYHDRGFALHSMRTPSITRLYVQCAPDDSVEAWPDDRVWDELRARLELANGWTLEAGPVLEKGITTMRSAVMDPMQWGRLFIAGDAAHVVPPTGAKGMNLAIADVRVLGAAIAEWYRTGRKVLLDEYSRTCLRRVWSAEYFSWLMTSMLHRAPDGDAFQQKLQLAQLRYVTESRAAAGHGRELRRVRPCLTKTRAPTRASIPECEFAARSSGPSTSIAPWRTRPRSTRRSSGSSLKSRGARCGPAMGWTPERGVSSRLRCSPR
jgi:p-hydroxybenzoate 3-monooxygenase